MASRKMTLERRNTGSVCGLNDMYGDEIEKAFGKIEQKMADIVRKLESNASPKRMYYDVITSLSKAEVDEIRRFLFIMLYRSLGFHNRFEASAAGYNSNDQDSLHAYMLKKGLKAPIDVWLHNFRVFLETPLGPDRDLWEKTLFEKAYPPDAQIFVDHVNNYTLHICHPHDEDDKFILTQNAYGVFEGPISSVGWTSWHFLSPLSPRLLMVLRHNDIKVLGLDVDDSMNLYLEKLTNFNLAIQSDPGMMRSWLRDLPVYPALCGLEETYQFKHFPISSKHVQIINSIFLDNASSAKVIIYSDEKALTHALEYFLRIQKRGLKLWLPSRKEVDTGLTLKASGEEIRKITGVDNERYDSYLQGLEKIASGLGSMARVELETLSPNNEALLPQLPPRFEKRYRKLGWNGTTAAWLEDLKFVSATLAVNELSEVIWRKDPNALYHYLEDVLKPLHRDIVAGQFTRQSWLGNRMWEAIRHFQIPTMVILAERLREMVSDDFECSGDKIADVCHVFRPDSAAGLMASALQLQWTIRHEIKYSGRSSHDAHFEHAYSLLGSIRHCGLEVVERQVEKFDEKLLKPEVQRQMKRVTEQCGDEDEIIEEVKLRIWLHEDFETILGDLDSETKETLKYVLFNIAYPLPEKKMESKQGTWTSVAEFDRTV